MSGPPVSAPIKALLGASMLMAAVSGASLAAVGIDHPGNSTGIVVAASIGLVMSCLGCLIAGLMYRVLARRQR